MKALLFIAVAIVSWCIGALHGWNAREAEAKKKDLEPRLCRQHLGYGPR